MDCDGLWWIECGAAGQREALGSGVLTLQNGVLSGGNADIAFSGIYHLKGQQLAGELVVERHPGAQAQHSAFDGQTIMALRLTAFREPGGTVAGALERMDRPGAALAISMTFIRRLPDAVREAGRAANGLTRVWAELRSRAGSARRSRLL